MSNFKGKTVNMVMGNDSSMVNNSHDEIPANPFNQELNSITQSPDPQVYARMDQLQNQLN